ncbi:MAG: winged helix-turn-helix transcriptional regulator [Verrucomicrobiales bacterium]|jgi:predicted ArsR family transcriptional regulator|nr:winged helix-turn-helix transcriptional regulator [Verrucomicrobiales bacterium]
MNTLKRAPKNPKLSILTEIKRSQGLSVSELCERVGLSYMGVKQHCLALEREGYLDTWRRPKGMGRPEKAYRLTHTAQEFFPSEYGNFTTEILDSVREVYGANAADKILFNIYRNETEKLRAKINAYNLEDKMRQLAALREERGYMSEYYFNRDDGRQEIIEYNSPILLCIDRFAILRDLEQRLFENVLGVKIQRDEERVSGLYKCSFRAI